MLKIMPYKKGSKSAKILRQAFRGKMTLVNPERNPLGRGIVINWGCSKAKPKFKGRFLNRPESVRIAVNKLRAFQALRAGEVSIPEFTTDRAVAVGWLGEKNAKVVVRQLLESHSGNGIILAKKVNELPASAPLMVKYFKKAQEFRVHVFDGNVIDFVAKKKRSDIPEGQFNKYIRSYNNGWVFCRDGVTLPNAVRDEAIRAVRVLGLDFGAVDLAVNKQGRVVVFEVNCAPALEGTTIERYTAALANYVR